MFPGQQARRLESSIFDIPMIGNHHSLCGRLRSLLRIRLWSSPVILTELSPFRASSLSTPASPTLSNLERGAMSAVRQYIANQNTLTRRSSRSPSSPISSVHGILSASNPISCSPTSSPFLGLSPWFDHDGTHPHSHRDY